MSVDDDSLIECCLIFVVPDFFDSLSHKRTLRGMYDEARSWCLWRQVPQAAGRRSEVPRVPDGLDAGDTLTHRAKPATPPRKLIASGEHAVNCLAPLLASKADPISFQS